MGCNNKNSTAEGRSSDLVSGDCFLVEDLSLKQSGPLQNSKSNKHKPSESEKSKNACSNKSTILLDGKVLRAVNDSETILESVENAGIELEFHCREGFCGVCRTKLLSGKVDYTLDPLAFIEDDEILICCSKPIGDIELKTLM